MTDKNPSTSSGNKAADGGSRPGIGKPENRGGQDGSKAGGNPPPKEGLGGPPRQAECPPGPASAAWTAASSSGSSVSAGAVTVAGWEEARPAGLRA